MIQKQKWTEHEFNLGIHPGWAYNIISRLKDTSLRLKHHTSELTGEEVSRRTGESWSIKEHIGHLVDLEDLHLDRLHQFADLREELIAADMKNKRTEEANHNNKDITTLIENFKRSRDRLMEKFNALSDNVYYHEAYHARLGTNMKPVDMLFFTAEHDDHHINAILEIKHQLEK